MSTKIEFPAFYLTAPNDCPYLPKEVSASLLLDPASAVSDGLFSKAIESGFRRSGKTIYRPYCNDCQACQSVKIDAINFKASRSQKRTIKRNQDVSHQFTAAVFDARHFDLYCRYQSWKHTGDEMDHGDRDRYEDSMVNTSVKTVFIEFYIEQKLVAVSVVDIAERGLSAVYTFFDPDEANRSLGRYAILTLVKEVQKLDLEYVYLGYWIQNCSKMNYKSEYRPLLVYDKRHWVDLHEKLALEEALNKKLSE